MNREQLVSAVATETGISRAVVTVVLSDIMAQITNAVARGDEVRLVGFGVFKLNHYNRREARNPATGAPVQVPAHYKPKFVPGKPFKDLVLKTKVTGGSDE